MPAINYGPFNVDILRFLHIYSAFENEYIKIPKSKRKKDDSIYKEIRKSALKQLKNIPIENESDAYFMEQAKSRVQEIGTQLNSKEKIIGMYQMFKPYLVSSVELFFQIREFNIESIADELSKVRNSIVHNNLERDLSDNEIRGICFLEWLTYCMFLTRIGLPIEVIEAVLGAVFGCNLKHNDYLFIKPN